MIAAQNTYLAMIEKEHNDRHDADNSDDDLMVRNTNHSLLAFSDDGSDEGSDEEDSEEEEESDDDLVHNHNHNHSEEEEDEEEEEKEEEEEESDEEDEDHSLSKAMKKTHV